MRSTTIKLIERSDDLERIASRLAGRTRIALDLESNGMHAYAAKICIIQIFDGEELYIVDTLSADITALAHVIASCSVIKIVHDVSFDARMFADAGMELNNVQDTHIAARLLGRKATGLASLLGSELSVTVNKALQTENWARRPLSPAMLTYLADDVVHLHALADALFAEAAAHPAIANAVDEETRYRLACAWPRTEDQAPTPPYLRLRGIERAGAREQMILRRLANVREAIARDCDVPPHNVVSAQALFAIAEAKPQTPAQLTRVAGALSSPFARDHAQTFVHAVIEGLEDRQLPEADAEHLATATSRPPPAWVRRTRAIHQALTQWRRTQAVARGVDEQVVLPGHCLAALTAQPDASLASLYRVPGLGAFRIAHDGEALVRVIASARAS